MEYPEGLLPRRHYRLIDADALPKSAVFLRRLNLGCDSIELDEFGEIPASVLLGHESLSKLDGLSINLCGDFQPEHLRLRVTGVVGENDPSRYWQPGEAAVAPNAVQFESLTDICPAYLRLESCHELAFPARDEASLQHATSFSGRVRIVHRPTITNYWHFEVVFHDGDGSIVGANKSSWKSKAYAFVFRQLLQSGGVTLDPIPCPDIPAASIV